MMNCLKCQKEYNPKRVDGLFCGGSCGNAYRQQKKRDAQRKKKLIELGQAIEKPLTEEESQLRSLLVGLAGNAKKLLGEKALSVDKKPADWDERLSTHLMNCQALQENELVRDLTVRFEGQQKAEKEAIIAYRTRYMNEQDKQTWLSVDNEEIRLVFENIALTQHNNEQAAKKNKHNNE